MDSKRAEKTENTKNTENPKSANREIGGPREIVDEAEIRAEHSVSRAKREC